MKATQTTPAPPVNWDARCKLAASILSWRPPNSLTGTLARKALEGYSIEALMAFERAFKADEAGAA